MTTFLRFFSLAIILCLSIKSVSAQDYRINHGWVGKVRTLRLSPDYKHLAVLGDESIHILETENYRQIGSMDHEQTSNLTSLFFVSNQDLAIYSKRSLDNESITTDGWWPYMDYSQVEISTGHYDFTSKLMYVGYIDSTLKSYEIIYVEGHKRLKLKSTITLTSPATNIVSFKKTLFVGQQDGNIALYNTSNGKLIKILKGHYTQITSISLNMEGTILASASCRSYAQSKYGEGIIWDLTTGNILYRTADSHKQVLSSAIDEHDHVYFSSLMSIEKYSKTGEALGSYVTSGYDPIFVYYNNRLIYGISDQAQTDQNLYVIDANSLSLVQKIPQQDKQVWHIDFVPHKLLITKRDGVSILTPEKNDIKTIEVMTGSKSTALKGDFVVGAVSTTEMDKVYVYNVFTDQSRIWPLEGEVKGKYFLDYMVYHDSIYAISNSAVYNISAGSRRILTLPSGPVIFTPAQGIYVQENASEKYVELKNAISGNSQATFPNRQFIRSQDSSMIYLIDNKINKVYGVALDSFKQSVIIDSIENPYPYIYKITASPDKRYVAVKYGDLGNSISIIDIETNQTHILSPLARHVDCIAITPNSNYLLTGNRYGDVEIWSLKTGRPMGVIYTGSTVNDYVIVFKNQFDGTADGIKYFLRQSSTREYTQVEGLLQRVLFE